MSTTMSRGRARMCGGVLFSVLASLGAVPEAEAEDSVSFSQYSWNWDGTLYPSSDWGEARLTYTPLAGDTYLNLAINGVWQVEDLRLMHPKGTGVEQSSVFHFNLGNVSGEQVLDLRFDFSLTPAPMGAMPSGALPAPVAAANAALFSGDSGGRLGPLAAPTGTIRGGLLSAPPNTALNFPNQQAGPGTCVPVAVSNSLQYLVQEGKLNASEELTSIETAKQMTGWRAGRGAIIKPGPGQEPWWETKKRWMESHNVAVTTRVFSPGDTPESRERFMRQLQTERADRQDVEINLFNDSVEPDGVGHAVAVVGVEPSTLDPGFWNMLIVDDLDQEDYYNDMSPRWVSFDTWTGVVEDPNFDEIINAVVECPEPGTLLLVSGGALLALRRRRA